MNEKINNFQNRNFEDVDNAVNSFNDILTDAAKRSLKFIHPRIKRRTGLRMMSVLYVNS